MYVNPFHARFSLWLKPWHLANGQFTTAQIIEFVEQKHPELTPVQKSSYSKPLRRLAENSELIIVQKAKGRHPTIYTRPVNKVHCTAQGLGL